jgi:hypothetical protein
MRFDRDLALTARTKQVDRGQGEDGLTEPQQQAITQIGEDEAALAFVLGWP